MKSLHESLADDPNSLQMQIEALKKNIEEDNLNSQIISSNQVDNKAPLKANSLGQPNLLKDSLLIPLDRSLPDQINPLNATKPQTNKWKPLNEAGTPSEQPVLLKSLVKSENNKNNYKNEKALINSSSIQNNIKDLNVPHRLPSLNILNSKFLNLTTNKSINSNDIIIIEDDADNKNLKSNSFLKTSQNIIPIKNVPMLEKELGEFKDIMWSKKLTADKQKEQVLIVKSLNAFCLKTDEFLKEIDNLGKILDRHILNLHAYILYSKYEECIKAHDYFMAQKINGRQVSPEIVSGCAAELIFSCDLCSQSHLFQRCKTSLNVKDDVSKETNQSKKLVPRPGSKSRNHSGHESKSRYKSRSKSVSQHKTNLRKQTSLEYKFEKSKNSRFETRLGTSKSKHRSISRNRYRSKNHKRRSKSNHQSKSKNLLVSRAEYKFIPNSQSNINSKIKNLDSKNIASRSKEINEIVQESDYKASKLSKSNIISDDTKSRQIQSKSEYKSLSRNSPSKYPQNSQNKTSMDFGEMSNHENTSSLLMVDHEELNRKRFKEKEIYFSQLEKDNDFQSEEMLYKISKERKTEHRYTVDNKIKNYQSNIQLVDHRSRDEQMNLIYYNDKHSSNRYSRDNDIPKSFLNNEKLIFNDKYQSENRYNRDRLGSIDIDYSDIVKINDSEFSSKSPYKSNTDKQSRSYLRRNYSKEKYSNRERSHSYRFSNYKDDYEDKDIRDEKRNNLNKEVIPQLELNRRSIEKDDFVKYASLSSTFRNDLKRKRSPSFELEWPSTPNHPAQGILANKGMILSPVTEMHLNVPTKMRQKPEPLIHLKERKFDVDILDTHLVKKRVALLHQKMNSYAGNNFTERDLSHVELQAIIGNGSLGPICKVNDKLTGNLSTLHKLSCTEEEGGISSKFFQEYRILRKISHPNIIRLVDIIVDKSEKGSFYYEFNFIAHDVEGIISSKFVSLRGEDIGRIMKQVFDALRYLHEKVKIVHAGLTSSCVLVDSKGLVKICRFSEAGEVDKPMRLKFTQNSKLLNYYSPEILLGEKLFKPSMDIWSAGCIIGELFSQKRIFLGIDRKSQLEAISVVCGSPNPLNWPLVVTLPGYDPDSTLSHSYSRTIIDSFFFIPYKSRDLLNSLLTLDPIKRLSAEEALDSEWLRDLDPLQFSSTALPLTKYCHKLMISKGMPKDLTEPITQEKCDSVGNAYKESFEQIAKHKNFSSNLNQPQTINLSAELVKKMLDLIGANHSSLISSKFLNKSNDQYNNGKGEELIACLVNEVDKDKCESVEKSPVAPAKRTCKNLLERIKQANSLIKKIEPILDPNHKSRKLSPDIPNLESSHQLIYEKHQLSIDNRNNYISTDNQTQYLQNNFPYQQPQNFSTSKSSECLPDHEIYENTNYPTRPGESQNFPYKIHNQSNYEPSFIFTNEQTSRQNYMKKLQGRSFDSPKSPLLNATTAPIHNYNSYEISEAEKPIPSWLSEVLKIKDNNKLT